MANLEKEFDEFFKKIDLSPSKEEELRKKRDCLKDEIIEYFSSKDDYNQPNFLLQGSMDMCTTINPLDEEYDIDYGIYINKKDIDYKNENTWPNIEELHELIAEACKPKKRTIDTSKDTCVRVIYAKNYHVDFPIYIKNWEDEIFIPKLAHKKDGWVDSDAKANTNYFIDCNKGTNDALRHIVMFLKAMVDYQNHIEGEFQTDISGFELTMLACRDYKTNGQTEIDKIWYTTLEEMHKKCNANTSLQKPVTKEELWINKKQQDKDSFIKLLKFAVDNTRKSIDTTSEKEASEYYREIFGDRFPKLTQDAKAENLGASVVVQSATSGC